MSSVSFGVCFSLGALRRTSALNNDFSRRHLCQNPPALAGGRLRKKGNLNLQATNEDHDESNFFSPGKRKES